MRCNDFDAHIDEMLSGILLPDANQHMRQCERCTSHFRARALVQHGLRTLASATVSASGSASKLGPSRATDRIVMESYRRLQQRRAAAWNSETTSASAAPTAHLFTFPSRSLAPAGASRTWWTSAAAAAVVFAVLGSAVHLWTDVPTVNAPVVTTAPAVPAAQPNALVKAGDHVAAANAALRHGLPRPAALSSQSGVSQSIALSSASQPGFSLPEVATAGFRSTSPESPLLSANTTSAHPAIAYGEASNYDSGPVTHISSNVAPVIRLASSGAASNVAQSASSTWPGYSNLMYCDPMVCSGPMQVVHIKVPVGQVKPNLGQTVGNAFVNAEVVIGPDGVARAIRVAN
jgi:hypothetical protein